MFALQGRTWAETWYISPVTGGAQAYQVYGCHCEPVRTLVWQSVLFAAAQNEKQHFGRIRKALRICPKDYQFAKFLCGAADCHVASLLAMTCKNLLRVRIARTHLGRNVVHFTRAWRCASLPGLWMSLRGAGRPPRDVAIRSPAAAHNERQYLGRIRSSLRIRLKCYFSLPFPAGTRIAASLRSSQ